MKPIITEHEIKNFAKDECIEIVGGVEFGKSRITRFDIDKQWNYEENRSDNFAKWRKHNLTNQMFNQDEIGNDVF